MAGYRPIKIPQFESGLIKSMPDFDIPDDAFTSLENAYTHRKRVLRKKGGESLQRLRRVFTAGSLGNTSTNPQSFDSFVLLSIDKATTEPDAELEVGSVVVTVAAPDSATFTDDGLGGFTVTGIGDAATSSINYQTGVITLGFTGAFVGSSAITVNLAYFPCLSAMGLRRRELSAINSESLIPFDTKYAYERSGGKWVEFISGTTWSGTNSDFFWTVNYWTDASNNKLFWVTNFSGTAGDPIRYTNGTTWTDFAPDLDSGSASQLRQARILIPFRNRMLAINTREGSSLAASVHYPQRIRWAQIGNPIQVGAWIDSPAGKGGYINIPTAENIISAGFVRDNLIIFCERSTWQLRYTGISIQPFTIEKVNTELGSGSPFSIIPFDTSVMAISDKGVVSCDSFKSVRIDEEKIPDLVLNSFNNDNSGNLRVHGIRDYVNRLAYWSYPNSNEDPTFPNRRLVYNYENNSWSIFKDNYTCFGIYQDPDDTTWESSEDTWEEAVYSWSGTQSQVPEICGGTQQGFILILDKLSKNDESLSIQDITGNTTTPTSLTVRNHNLETGQVIEIKNIPAGTPFASALNDSVFGVYEVVDADTFLIASYDSSTGEFDDPQLAAPATYIGGGVISILDNFSMLSKKFSHISEGQKMQLGYIDLLVDSTTSGAFNMNLYIDYAGAQKINEGNDSFFNTTVNTQASALQVPGQDKSWQRVICPVNGNFIQIEYNLSNAQMAGIEQSQQVNINSEVLWERLGGRMTL